MISILSKAATWFREQPFGEAFSCVFSSPPCSAQLIWTAVIDTDGAVYVTGTTFSRSRDFPVTPNAIQTFWRGVGRRTNLGGDAFLAKLSPDGTELIYSTYLGGSLGDIAEDIAVTAEGSAYITGSTESPDFPVTSMSLQPLHPAEPGRSSAFVTKIAPDGSSLIYSTFLGGSFQEYGTSIAVDREGNALVAGTRFSEDFPLTQGTLRLGSEGFLAKLDPEGSRLLYAADVGGSRTSLAVDGEGNTYLVGSTLPSALPPTPGAVQPCGTLPRVFAARPAFAAKVGPNGEQLLYATFLSVHLTAEARGIAVGQDGSIYVTGWVNDREFPATLGSPFLTGEYGFAALLARFAPTPGTRLYPSMIRNGASYEPGPIAPGEWISIFNPALGPEDPVVAELDENGVPPTTLGNTRVLFSGIPAVITYAHHCQINAIAPFGIEGLGQTEITVEHFGERSEAVRVPVGTVRPGLYTAGAIGFGNAAALNQDLSRNGPRNPAAKGSVVALFGTGAGRMDPPLVDGDIPSDPLPSIAADTRVLYQVPESEQWLEAEVTFAGAAHGLVAGLVQINFRVPADFGIPLEESLGLMQIKWAAEEFRSQAVDVWVAAGE